MITCRYLHVMVDVERKAASRQLQLWRIPPSSTSTHLNILLCSTAPILLGSTFYTVAVKQSLLQLSRSWRSCHSTMATTARSEGKTPTPTASKLPLISIIGTTGVGKSQLSISLAQSICQQPLDSTRCHPYTKSEIINSDSMQLYHGSPILTNKVTEVEMEGVKHHLMDFLDVGAECTVGKWRELALSKVSL